MLRIAFRSGLLALWPRFEAETGSWLRAGSGQLRRGRLALLVLVVGAIGLGCYAFRTYSARAATSGLTLHTVTKGPLRERVPAARAGRVSAARELVMRAEWSTRVLRLEKRVGDYVHAGELLLSLEPAELEDAVVAAERALVTARAQAGEAAARAALARSLAQSSSRLAASGVAPRADATRTKLESTIAASSAYAATARVRELEARLEAARRNSTRTELHAPFSGVLLELDVVPGEAVAMGAKLAVLADMQRLHVAAEMDEADVGRVSVGMPVELSFDALGDGQLLRHVTEVEPAVRSDERGARIFKIRIDLDDTPELRVGMGVHVDVIAAERASAVLAPINALRGSGPVRNALVVRGERLEPRPVQVGIASWDYAEVKSGLEAGERLVLNPSLEALPEPEPAPKKLNLAAPKAAGLSHRKGLE